MGGGRFDLVSWDPRGTGESTHARCFANDRAQARFWGPDWSTPTTRRESVRYLPKALAFVKRCVALSGRLLATTRPPTRSAIVAICAGLSATDG